MIRERSRECTRFRTTRLSSDGSGQASSVDSSTIWVARLSAAQRCRRAMQGAHRRLSVLKIRHGRRGPARWLFGVKPINARYINVLMLCE